MKTKIISLTLLVAIACMFASCEKKDQPVAPPKPIVKIVHDTVTMPAPVATPKALSVTAEDFATIVKFVENNGAPVKEDTIFCDHKCVVLNDSTKTRQEVMTIKRDSLGNPSLRGTVNQICVVAYVAGYKDADHRLVYTIYKDHIDYGSDTSGVDFDKATQAFQDLLLRAKKQKDGHLHG
jgi:hypothetical protein